MLINPRPQYTQVRETYDPDYSQGYIVKAKTKLRRCRRWIRRIQRHVHCGRWLDIGCSAGFVVKAATEAGYEAWGIDVERGGIAFARETLGLEHVTTGLMEDQHYPDDHFDVITLYDVIEHVPDLNFLVMEIKRLLRPGGLIEIRTPDLGHWRVPKNLSQWPEVKPSEHLYYFTRATLNRLMQAHGLELYGHRLSLKPGLKVYARHAGGYSKY